MSGVWTGAPGDAGGDFFSAVFQPGGDFSCNAYWDPADGAIDLQFCDAGGSSIQGTQPVIGDTSADLPYTNTSGVPETINLVEALSTGGWMDDFLSHRGTTGPGDDLWKNNDACSAALPVASAPQEVSAGITWFGTSSGATCANYELSLSVVTVPDDMFEDNDDVCSPSSLGNGLDSDLIVRDGDSDFYEFDIFQGEVITFAIDFVHEDGGLDTRQWDVSGGCLSPVPLDWSGSIDDYEEVSYQPTNPGFIANLGGSPGNLCIGSEIGRLVGPGQILSSGTTGYVGLNIDLNALPLGSQTVAAAPGETWYFQRWFRDVSGGMATSNFSSALRVRFE